MPRIRPSRRFGLLAAALAVACTSDPVTLCGCSPPSDTAILYGRVTNADGAPVQNAVVTAELRDPGCGPLDHERLGEVNTEADGTYRAYISANRRLPRPGDCLRAMAAPPAQSGLGASEPVAFSVIFTRREPFDSARVDLVLRAP
jgi:hypothetical protein